MDGETIKSKEKLWNYNYNMVMVGNFSLYFAFYLLSPLLPIYLSDEFHATKDISGVILSCYTLAALMSRPFSGFMMDGFNRKKFLILSFFFFSLFFASYAAAGTLLVFAIFRALHGAPYGAVTVANSTAAVDVLPSSRRTEGIGFYGLSNNVATAIAPFAGVTIYQMTGNFLLIFGISFVVACLGMLAVSSIKMPQREAVKNVQKVSFDRFFLLNGWLLAVIIFSFGFSYGVLSNYLAIYSEEVLHVTEGVGPFFFLLSLGLIASRIQGSRALREGRITENASVGILISLIGYGLFVICQNKFGYFGSAILIGLGNGHMYPAFQNMFINMAGNNRRGTANSTILLSWDAGSGVGLLSGGVFAENFGYTSAFMMMFVLNFLGALIYFIVGKRDYISKCIHL